MSFTTTPFFATLKLDSKASLKNFKTFLCSVFGVRSYPLFTENAVWFSCKWPISQMWNRYSLSSCDYLAAQGHLLWDDCLLHVAFFCPLIISSLLPFTGEWQQTKHLIINPHVWLVKFLAGWVTINLATLCWIISFSRAVKALFPQRSLFSH